MKYYNVDRLHSANDDMSPVEYENLQIKVSGNGRPEQCIAIRLSVAVFIS